MASAFYKGRWRTSVRSCGEKSAAVLSWKLTPPPLQPSYFPSNPTTRLPSNFYHLEILYSPPLPSRIGIPQQLPLQTLYPTLPNSPPSPKWYSSPLSFSQLQTVDVSPHPGPDSPTTQSQRALRQARSRKERETRECGEEQAEMGSAYIKALDR